MAFKRLTVDQFRALPDGEKDAYRYALERADRRARNLWFWCIGAAIVTGLATFSDGGLQLGLLSALSLWIVFLMIR